MSFLRRPTSTNALVGIFLLVLLAVFAGPGMLPRIISSIIPSADESIPCEWLRSGENRAEHQSLIGRSMVNPISLRVRTSALPRTAEERLVINIIVSNDSIGTVAIYYNPTQVRLGDDGVTSGLGVVFNSPGGVPAGGQGSGAAYPEADIRLLGPRQSCVHRIEFPANQYPDPSIGTGNATVKAYYRNTTRGISAPMSSLATPIFPDQGLWTGVAESAPVTIPFASG
jgi:hypothetical protein